VKKHHIVHMHLANYDSSCIGFTVLSLQIFINFYHSLFIYAASARVLRHVPLYQPVGFHTLLNEAVNSTCAWFWWKAWNKKIYRGLFLSKLYQSKPNVRREVTDLHTTIVACTRTNFSSSCVVYEDFFS